MSKLIKSVVGIALTVAVVGTGVWAFTTQDFNFVNPVDFDISGNVIVRGEAYFPGADPFSTYDYNSTLTTGQSATWSIPATTLTPSQDELVYFFSFRNIGEPDLSAVVTPFTPDAPYTFTGGLFEKQGEDFVQVLDAGNAVHSVVFGADDTVYFIYTLSFGTYPTEAPTQDVKMSVTVKPVDPGAQD